LESAVGLIDLVFDILVMEDAVFGNIPEGFLYNLHSSLLANACDTTFRLYIFIVYFLFVSSFPNT
jgi:hypothetical protein